MGRDLYSYCDFITFFGSIIGAKEGAISARGIRISDTNCDSRYSALARLLVTNHVCNVFEVKLFSLVDAYASS